MNLETKEVSYSFSSTVATPIIKTRKATAPKERYFNKAGFTLIPIIIFKIYYLSILVKGSIAIPNTRPEYSE
jgi:hypothetical protein